MLSELKVVRVKVWYWTDKLDLEMSSDRGVDRASFMLSLESRRVAKLKL